MGFPLGCVQSIELRHPKGQHFRISELCEAMVQEHDTKLVAMLEHHARDADLSELAFAEMMCGRDVAGLCK